MPLPTVEIQAFGPPSVKGGVLAQPMHLSDGSRAFVAKASAWRDLAWDILAITEPTKPRTRPSTPIVRSPILKPNRRIL